LPWRIPGDLKHFKAVTMGKPLVMGRKTYESIGKPLPGRTNLVLTRDKDWRAEGVMVAHSLEEVLRLANEDANKTGANEIAIIGGSSLFEELLPSVSKIELTEVHAFAGRRRLLSAIRPHFRFRETRREGPMQGDKDEYAYSVVTLERI
jgi:dihydrofolate reductase